MPLEEPVRPTAYIVAVACSLAGLLWVGVGEAAGATPSPAARVQVRTQLSSTADDVAVCVVLPGGTRLEKAGLSGSMNILRMLLTRGMPGSRLSDQASLVREYGGRSTFDIETSRLTLCEQGPPSILPFALRLTQQRLLPLIVSPKTFEQAREDALSQLKRRTLNARSTALDKARQLAFQEAGSLSHPALGTPAGHARTTLTDVVELHAQLLSSPRIGVGIAGAVSATEAAALAEDLFTRVPPVQDSRPPAPSQSAVAVFQRNERFATARLRGLSRPHVAYVWPLPDATSLGSAIALTEALNSPSRHPAVLGLLEPKGPLAQLNASVLSSAPPHLLAIDFELGSSAKATVDKARALLRRALVAVSQSPTARSEQTAPNAEASPQTVDVATLAALTALGAPNNPQAQPGRIQELVSERLTEAKRTTVEVYPERWRMDPPPRVVRRTHRVRKGDTLIGIAKRYGARVKEIAKANGLRRRGFIYPGQELVVPVDNRPKKPAKREKTYRVRKGDSLSVIAAKHQISTKQLRDANQLKKKSVIRVGQALRIPPSGKPKRRTVVVKKGDSWIRLAKRHHTTPKELARANGRATRSKLLAGETLYLPHRSSNEK